MLAEIRCFWLEPTGETIVEENADAKVTYNTFRRVDTGEVFKSIRDAGVGAMWDATWLKKFVRPEAELLALPPEEQKNRFCIRAHPDGRVLCVQTPAGEWNIDQASDRGAFWQRTGEPPYVTATPSIWFYGEYHGWLQGGLLKAVPGQP